MDAADALVFDQVGAELLEVAEVGALAEQVEVEVGEDRPELIGVDELPGVPLMVLDGETVGELLGPAGEDDLEEAIVVDPLHRCP